MDQPHRVIASTDADTIVTPTWLADLTREIELGADAVGGRIIPETYGDAMDSALRRYHLRDVTFQHLIAELESRLDPVAHDPWPRHHQHFGANFGVTVGTYLRVGGIPRVHTLEDMAFFDTLRRSDARVRHSPRVLARTSARRDGRVAMGLSTQLGEWANAVARSEIPLVESATSAEARVRERRGWREFWIDGRSAPPAEAARRDWFELKNVHETFGAFYDATQSETPHCSLEPVTHAITALRLRLAELRALPPLPLLSAPLQHVEPVSFGAQSMQVLQGQAVIRVQEGRMDLVASQRVVVDERGPVHQDEMAVWRQGVADERLGTLKGRA